MNLQKYPVWKVADPVDVDPGVLEAAGGDWLVARVLARRGIQNSQAARAFLDPDQYRPSPPTSLPGLDALVDRLSDAIQSREPICVWGDFDVDGQTSTTILVDTLRRLGADVRFHIPVRATESHGVNLPGLQNEIDQGARLILTCDTGSTAHEAAAYAAGRGVDFLISDHHALSAELPPAFSLVNPHLLPEDHPLATLSGVGVAYQIALELSIRAGRPEIAEDQVELAALGIVADVAEQRGDTRWLLQVGLEKLRASPRLWLKALCQNTRLIQENIDEESIGFTIGPRLNALGRLADANRAVEFFTTRDIVYAEAFTRELEALNYRRRLLVEQVFLAAKSQVEIDPALLDGQALVLSHPAWPAGVVGIVASRLADQYGKPVILLCTPEGEFGRGSARSIEGVDITGAIAACADLLTGFGGHPMAAGLGIDPGRIPEFRRRLNRAIEEQTGSTLPERVLLIESELPLVGANLELVKRLTCLAPFGPGNPGLVFSAGSVLVESVSTFGRSGEHREVLLRDHEGRPFHMVWWYGAEMAAEVVPGFYDIAFQVHASIQQGETRLQLEWVDARPAPQKLEIIPTRKGPKLLDLRSCEAPFRQLQLGREAVPEMLVWREGSSEPAGVDRRGLKPSKVLAIWSAPPGPDELQLCLDAVQPEEVLIFGQDAGLDTPEVFLRVLLGMLKYGFKRDMVTFDLSTLAAASGHRVSSVKIGLETLGSRGIISVEGLADLTAKILPGGTVSSIQTSEHRLTSILAETAAYRALFRILPPEALIPAKEIRSTRPPR